MNSPLINSYIHVNIKSDKETESKRKNNNNKIQKKTNK